ncbi:MAG: response regulator [Candidatus Anammoxibacter sp.]
MINTQEQSKILIVDDKPENLFALGTTLQVLDAVVIKASGGNDALKATLNNDFALIVIDVQMPEMDGYELAEILRGRDETKNIPIIFLSAVYSSDSHIFKGYESGAVDYLVKPVNSLMLLSKCRVFTSIDQHKRELKSRNELLEHEINEHIKTKEKLLRSSELMQLKKINALGTMTAGIAHEMNNCLMGLINFIRYSIKHTTSDDKRYKVLQDSEKLINRCIEIVGNLLKFAHVDLYVKQKRQRISVTEMFKQVLKVDKS